MSLLLDAFEDAGLDRETIAFLLEALQYAEPDDWGAIVDPFVPSSEPVVAVLTSEPNVVERTVAALEKEAAEAEAWAAAEAAKPLPNADSRFLDVFICGHEMLADEESPQGSSEHLPGALSCSDVYALARCQRLCRRARDLVSAPPVWEPRLRAVCATWSLPCPASPPEGRAWRDLFFEARRPRCDGVYVGECRYVHHIRPGSTLDAKLMSKLYHHVEYRRYLRLLPPDAADGGVLRALVLRDVCPFKAAVEALGRVDPRTHVNCLLPERSLDSASEKRVALETLVAVGTYTWSSDQVEVRFENSGDHYTLAFALGDGADGDMCFSGRLEWASYLMRSKQGEDIPFGLGRSIYGGGESADGEKDHFPNLYIRQCRQLEHLL